MPDEQADTLSSSDHAGDQDDRGGDRDDHGRDQNDDAGDQDDRERDQAHGDTPHRQFAKNYPDPNGPGPLQIWPLRTRDEFDSDEAFWNHIDAFTRWNNGMPPPKPLPSAEEMAGGVPEPTPPAQSRPPPPSPSPSPSRRPWLKAHHVGIRLTGGDYELLTELARAHAVALGTMARMLVVRGVRAAAQGVEPDRDE